MKKNYGINSPIAPLWLMYPYISRYSIGWRMGYGEEYKYEFSDWYTALSDEERKQYQQMFPAPKGWLDWYDKKTEPILICKCSSD